MLIYVLACHSAFTYTGMVKAVHSCLSVLMPILCVCVCVCGCGQWVAASAASAGVWHAERPDPGALLLHDALCGLLHDVPPDQRTVRHQTLHHLQHARGNPHFTHWCLQTDVSLYFDHMLICKDAAVAPAKTLHLRQTRILTLLFTV